MERFILPWESDYYIKNPLVLPIFCFILGTILSVITWVRMKK